jgi:anti-sigma regulatory factor (Ser/Thr protein kinase)/CheY-like chemotaxis protein
LLLVDADAAVHEVLRRSLASADLAVESSFDTSEALTSVQKFPFDAVFAGGANGDGVELLSRLQTMRPRTPVIVAGAQDPAAAIESIRLNAYCYFHKPLQTSNVADMVRQALATRSWMRDIRLISAKPDWITLDIRCKLDAADRTTHFIRELEADLPPNVREDLASAFRELLMNAVEHGARSDPRKRVRASLVRTSRSIVVHIHDPGPGFSLDFLPHAAISNPHDSPTRHVEVRAEAGKRPGGFGIMITRNLVDELMYNEKGNAVLFVKHLR